MSGTEELVRSTTFLIGFTHLYLQKLLESVVGGQRIVCLHAYQQANLKTGRSWVWILLGGELLSSTFSGRAPLLRLSWVSIPWDSSSTSKASIFTYPNLTYVAKLSTYLVETRDQVKVLRKSKKWGVLRFFLHFWVSFIKWSVLIGGASLLLTKNCWINWKIELLAALPESKDY